MTTIADNVKRVSPDKLIPYTNNAKEHPDEQVKKIASSIKNYGWDQPIVVDGENEIIKGHGRLQAAELLGLDEVPVISRDDLTDAEKRASRIADNKTAEAPWDEELLATELETVPDFDAESLGFNDDELDELLNPADMEIPESFEEIDDEEIETEHKCPECGYEW